jgi:hypothetical protein
LQELGLINRHLSEVGHKIGKRLDQATGLAKRQRLTPSSRHAYGF